MLDYYTLHNKAEIEIVKDGEKTRMKDLLSKTWNGSAPMLGKILKVEKYDIARPDLVSLAIYGTDKYGDAICKVNGISNPFELNEGMYILCPYETMMQHLFIAGQPASPLVSPKSSTNSNGTDDNLFKDFTTSMLTNDKANYDLAKEMNFKSKGETSTIGDTNKSGKKLKNERRSPVEQTVDDSNFVINKSLGLVIY